MDDEELETLKERAEFFGLDKTKNFEDFKGKYLKAAKDVEEYEKSAKIKADKVISGHSPAPKKATPGSVIDHTDDDGKVDARSFYDDPGMKERDIHTNNHGNPKWHNFGKHGEHAHD